MTKLEGFLLLRANPKFEEIPDHILEGLIENMAKESDGLISANELQDLKSYLGKYSQYYESTVLS